MSTKYNINPVKATCMKYAGKDHGIQGLNDTCFGICAAFSGTYDTYNMDPKCSKSCADFIEKRKHELFGVGSCDHQVPYRPVAWDQIPRFVPTLMKKGMDSDQAKNVCMQLCEQRIPLLASECKEACELDSNAVENYSHPSQLPQPSQAKGNVGGTKSTKNKDLLIGVIILLVIIIAIFLYKRIA